MDKNGKGLVTNRLGKTGRKAPGNEGTLPAEQTRKKLSLPCMINGHEPLSKRPLFMECPCKWCGRMMYWTPSNREAIVGGNYHDYFIPSDV